MDSAKLVPVEKVFDVPDSNNFANPDLLRRGLELHFLVHLELAQDADKALQEMGLGRPHHRILYFCHRIPGISVNEILRILKVSHQGILRPMNTLIDMELIEQKMGRKDRRRRQLFVTQKGEKLIEKLSSTQYNRVLKAYEAAGPEAVAGFWTVLRHMLPDELSEIDS